MSEAGEGALTQEELLQKTLMYGGIGTALGAIIGLVLGLVGALLVMAGFIVFGVIIIVVGFVVVFGCSIIGSLLSAVTFGLGGLLFVFVPIGTLCITIGFVVVGFAPFLTPIGALIGAVPGVMFYVKNAGQALTTNAAAKVPNAGLRQQQQPPQEVPVQQVTVVPVVPVQQVAVQQMPVVNQAQTPQMVMTQPLGVVQQPMVQNPNMGMQMGMQPPMGGVMQNNPDFQLQQPTEEQKIE